MINFPEHFLFFYFCLYFKICKYDKDNEYFLFPFLLEKWKIRLAEVCTDHYLFRTSFILLFSQRTILLTLASEQTCKLKTFSEIEGQQAYSRRKDYFDYFSVAQVSGFFFSFLRVARLIT